MTPRLHIEPLRSEHLRPLARHLRQEQVYAHIGGVPSLHDFLLDAERALAGPAPLPSGQASNERWLPYLVRDRVTQAMLGRLDATVHHGIAEVAFLFEPQHWGQGFAHEALGWLHQEVQAVCGIDQFWATTVLANTRCQALLVRTGYRPVAAGAPHLYSFEPGDLVFHLPVAALQTHTGASNGCTSNGCTPHAH